jgi:hypothetical protein
MLLLATLLWVISITNVHEGKDVPSAPPGVSAPRDPQTFPTYALCLKEMEENINEKESGSHNRLCCHYLFAGVRSCVHLASQFCLVFHYRDHLRITRWEKMLVKSCHSGSTGRLQKGAE